MANYFSGEEIKIGDFITTDNGYDKNKVMKLIDNAYLMQSYGLDCFGALLSSSNSKGMIFVSFKELSSPDTKFIRRKKNNLIEDIENELIVLAGFVFFCQEVADEM